MCHQYSRRYGTSWMGRILFLHFFAEPRRHVVEHTANRDTMLTCNHLFDVQCHLFHRFQWCWQCQHVNEMLILFQSNHTVSANVVEQ